MTAPFLLRLHCFCRVGLLPEGLGADLSKLENYSKWAERVIAMKSVTGGWDEEAVISLVRKLIEKRTAAAANGAN